MVKIICLGNEFVEGDSLAKEVGEELEKEGFDVVNVKDSFELMGVLASQGDAVSGERSAGLIILDVVEGLDCVREIGVGDLRVDGFLSAHDFDAGYVLALFGHDSAEPRLLGEEVRIIGIPMRGRVGEVLGEVKKIISN